MLTSYLVCIILLEMNKPYQERRREWPYDAQQPVAIHGVNSSKAKALADK
jgi:hypothetical protein